MCKKCFWLYFGRILRIVQSYQSQAFGNLIEMFKYLIKCLSLRSEVSLLNIKFMSEKKG